MPRQLFVNLPVSNLAETKAFWTALGFTFEPRFTDDVTGLCLVIEAPHFYAMLLSHEHFAGFAPRPMCDATKQVEVLNALMLDRREDVDAIVSKAVAAGGKTYAEPKDHGFMYQHGFTDLDGHVWEVGHMDLDVYDKMRAAAAKE